MRTTIFFVLMLLGISAACTMPIPVDYRIGCTKVKAQDTTLPNRDYVTTKSYVCTGDDTLRVVDTLHFLDIKNKWKQLFDENEFMLSQPEGTFVTRYSYAPEWEADIGQSIDYPAWSSADIGEGANAYAYAHYANTCADTESYAYSIFCRKYIDFDTISGGNRDSIAAATTIKKINELFNPQQNGLPIILMSKVIATSLDQAGPKNAMISAKSIFKMCPASGANKYYEYPYWLTFYRKGDRVPVDSVLETDHLRHGIYFKNKAFYIEDSGIILYLSELHEAFKQYAPPLTIWTPRTHPSPAISWPRFDLLGRKKQASGRP